MRRIGDVQIGRQGWKPYISVSAPWYSRLVTLQKILFVIDGVLVFGGVIAFIIDSPFDLPLIGAAIFLFLALEIGRHVVVEADTATAKTEGLTPTIKTESSEDNDK